MNVTLPIPVYVGDSVPKNLEKKKKLALVVILKPKNIVLGRRCIVCRELKYHRLHESIGEKIKEIRKTETKRPPTPPAITSYIG